MNIQGNAEQWEDGTFKTFAQLRLEDENAALRTRLEAAEKERDAWQLAYYERDIAYNKLVKRLEADMQRARAELATEKRLHELTVSGYRTRLEAAEKLPQPLDRQTARHLAQMIEANRVFSPYRDCGIRLKAFGKWLAALAGEE